MVGMTWYLFLFLINTILPTEGYCTCTIFLLYVGLPVCKTVSVATFYSYKQLINITFHILPLYTCILLYSMTLNGHFLHEKYD